MSGSPIENMRHRGSNEPGMFSKRRDNADQNTDTSNTKKKLGERFTRALYSKAADAPASNEAPRPAAAAAPAPELKDNGAAVRGLEARYDELVDDQITAKGRVTDADLIKSAALARKGSFVVSAMAEPSSRFKALNRRIEELVGLDNAKLAKIANEPTPEAVPETTPEAVPKAVEARTEPVPETRTAGILEHLDTIKGLQDTQGRIDEARFEKLILEGLSNPKTAWDKVDGTWADLVTVKKILDDLKIDKAKLEPEFPFLKINRINSALEAVRASIAKKDKIQVIVNASNRAVDIATVKEVARETATRVTDGETVPRVAHEMSPDEEVAQMMKQYEIKSRGLDSLHEQLRDYLKIAGLFGVLKGHARDLKRQIRDAETDLDKLMRAIDEKRVTSHKRSSITAGGDRARSQAERAGKGPYTT